MHQHEALAQAHRDAMIREQLLRDPDAAREALHCLGTATIAQQGAKAASAGAGEAFDPASVMAHWYTADSAEFDEDELLAFPDQSGTSDLDNVPGAPPLYAPSVAALNGRPSAFFVSSSSTYIRNNPVFTAIPQPFTIVLVWHPTAFAAGNPAMAGGTIGARYFIRRNSTTGWVQIHAGSGTLNSPLIIDTDTTYIGFFTFNGTATLASINGALLYSGDTSVGTGACSDLSLGRELASGYFDGYIPAAGVFAGDLHANTELISSLYSHLSEAYL